MGNSIDDGDQAEQTQIIDLDSMRQSVDMIGKLAPASTMTTVIPSIESSRAQSSRQAAKVTPYIRSKTDACASSTTEMGAFIRRRPKQPPLR